MKGYIYKFTNLINQKVYIGQTRQKLEIRYNQHINAKDNCPIHLAIKKHGIDNFKFEVIEELDLEKEDLIEKLNTLEIEYIKKYDSLCPNGYNVKEGGNVSRSNLHYEEYVSAIYRNEPVIAKEIVYDNILDYCTKTNSNLESTFYNCVLNIKKYFDKIHFVNYKKLPFYGESLPEHASLEDILEGKAVAVVMLPNNMEVKAKDQLVYCVIKSFDKKDGCFPSLQSIAEMSALSIPTIRDSIKRLENSEYIKIKRVGRKNYYTFSPYKKFEPFSPNFLERKDITPTTKSYLLAIQQYMDIEGVGKVSFSNRELSKVSGIPESTIRDCNNELKNKNFLTVLRNNNIDFITGCKTETKVFNLINLGQAVIWALTNHEQRIEENTNDIKEIKKQLAQMVAANEEQRKQIEEQNKLIQKLIEERKINTHEFKM